MRALVSLQLFQITSASLAYLSQKTTFKPLHPDIPVTFRIPDAETNDDVFEENKKELVQDLTRKAKQIEYLIHALPDKEPDHKRTQRMEALQVEMDQANAEYKATIQTAESLLEEINMVFNIMIKPTDQMSS
ncbi:Mediator complex, subunit Med21 [Phaffia rhodozyma]|uniref:Mediator of RNA polymerase II transcription subunit 21 n=1 Tax=Phaffia rhodozyma TaxID=264483 RepID=A0A0F7SSN7_PHARH|nr:Mediator complex, subunit Med21 [Phaffia rhodozyma]